jgi:2-succinyl-5-enolpyruvyl-6-hydroxy-3-cyclohexene-1-carboxylate synthase
MKRAKRPLIVCGPQPDPNLAQAVTSLASRLGAPLLADPLSQLRWGPHSRECVVDRYDSFLRDEGTAQSLIPDLVLRIGGTPTSKPLIQYLQRHSSAPLIIIAESRWPDPTLLAEEIVRADPATACAQLATSIGEDVAGDATWRARWGEIDRSARNALEQYACGISEPFEGAALADVAAVLPDNSALFVSSSMPVRDLDAFASGDQRRIRVLSNRGANGIDGVISTALGAAAGIRSTSGEPLVLVIGDLAFYHDMNGLLAARLHNLDATIVVLNNDGGGIFSFLPQAEHPQHFEQLFGTPHGLDFAPAATLYAASYERVIDSASLRRAVTNAIAGSGLHIIEMRTDRARNVVLHREAWAAVASAVDSI